MAGPPAAQHQAEPSGAARRRARVRSFLALAAVVAGTVGFLVWGAHILPGQFRTPKAGPQKESATPTEAAETIREAAPRFAAEADTRELCLGTLRAMEPAAQAEALTLALTDDDPAVKRAAAYCATALAPAGETLAAALIAASRAPEAAQAAVYALGRYPGPATTERLVQVLDGGGDDMLRVYAAWSLETAAQPEAVDVLLQCLSLDEGLTGMAAAKVLGRRKDPTARHACIELLEHLQPLPEPSGPGERAALCLAYMGDTSAIGPLRNAAHRLGDWRTGERLAVAFALCRLRPPDEYNFWLLRYAARRFLPPAPYRPKQTEAWANALVYLVQVEDERVLSTLVGATAGARGQYAEALTGAFNVLGYQPTPNPGGGGYILQELPPGQRPPGWLYSDEPPEAPLGGA